MVTEIGQSVSRERMDELFDLCLQALQYAILLESVTPAALPFVESLRALLRQMTDSMEPRLPAIHQGRPRLQIMEEQLVFLVKSGFQVGVIASLMNCSCRTIHRRLLEFRITSHHFTHISDFDFDLDQVIREINSLHPQSGERVIRGCLRSQGINVQRERVRQSLRRVDPTGVELRARHVLRRRRYHVDSPNALWHLDGYHKLIRWRIVIHGAIDGYSRLIM